MRNWDDILDRWTDKYDALVLITGLIGCLLLLVVAVVMMFVGGGGGPVCPPGQELFYNPALKIPTCL